MKGESGWPEQLGTTSARREAFDELQPEDPGTTSTLREAEGWDPEIDNEFREKAAGSPTQTTYIPQHQRPPSQSHQLTPQKMASSYVPPCGPCLVMTGTPPTRCICQRFTSLKVSAPVIQTNWDRANNQSDTNVTRMRLLWPLCLIPRARGDGSRHRSTSTD